MSRIKSWIHNQLDKRNMLREDMYYNADIAYELEQAMREEMEEPQNSEDLDIDPNTQPTNESNNVPF
tara:strand:- start:22 stop:222 length:201 start_codon:yes stop_codon:yes gene_type:complete